MSDLLVQEIEASGNVAYNDTTLCVYNYGCTNPNAGNYDPEAVVDDGSCMFAADDGPVVRYGCTDSVANNYDPLANFSDESCTYTGGCTNLDALNYDAEAILDDGTCEFTPIPQEEYVYGCTDETALNFNLANQSANVCTYLAGCTNPDAGNYDPLAITDDGSCAFISPLDDVAPVIYGCVDSVALNYNPEATNGQFL